jgi:hypothetical protein
MKVKSESQLAVSQHEGEEAGRCTDLGLGRRLCRHQRRRDPHDARRARAREVQHLLLFVSLAHHHLRQHGLSSVVSTA